MSQPAASSGLRIVKLLGIVALIGLLVAVGRIVLRALQEEGEPDDAHHGI